MITTVQCSICSQLNNKPRVVVTDFMLHHTCSIIILWLHSLSGVIRSLLLIKWVELARNRNKWLGRTRHPYIRAVHARYHARTCAQIRKRCGIDCHLVARTCDNEVGVAISIRDPYIYIAVHEPVQMTRSLSSTGPLSMQ